MLVESGSASLRVFKKKCIERQKRLQEFAVDKYHNFILRYGSVKCFLWSLNHKCAQLAPHFKPASASF